VNDAEYDKMRDLEDHYWWFVGRRRTALALLDQQLPTPNRPDVLDLGCGTGAVAQALDLTHTVTGLDMSEKALDYCRARGLTRLVQGDAMALPFPDASFDAVIALDVFEHLPDDEASFRECLRVLRPGGVLVLSVPAFRFLWGPHDVALHHFRRYTRSQVGERLTRNGFTIEKLTYAVFLLFPFVVLSRLADKFRRGPAQARLPIVAPNINRILTAVQAREGQILLRRNLPWGSSVVCAARKPG
jgi:SAM-dependent methyltransferase